MDIRPHLQLIHCMHCSKSHSRIFPSYGNVIFVDEGTENYSSRGVWSINRGLLLLNSTWSHFWYIQRSVSAHSLICISYWTHEIDNCSLFLSFHSSRLFEFYQSYHICCDTGPWFFFLDCLTQSPLTTNEGYQGVNGTTWFMNLIFWKGIKKPKLFIRLPNWLVGWFFTVLRPAKGSLSVNGCKI
jgi:hypothetical protein